MRSIHPRLRATLFLALLLPGCGTYRGTMPPAKTDFAPFGLDVLRGARVELTVLDRRPSLAESDLLIKRVRKSLTSALTVTGVEVGPGGDAELEVAVTQLRSELIEGRWQGCTVMTARLRRGAVDERIEADQCFTPQTTRETGSAQEALTESFHAALAQLLVGLDALPAQ